MYNITVGELSGGYVIKAYGVKLMKKHLAIFLTFIVLFASSVCVGANNEDFKIEQGFAIEFNGELTGYTYLISNDIHYVPLRIIFEKMGAVVYYRNRDRQLLALSRDGDMIRHTVGENIISVNGNQKVIENPSFIENNTTYIPLDMVKVALSPDGISYNDHNLNIQKQMYYSSYHEAVKDVLDVRWLDNFYPEKFQDYINYHRKISAYSIHDVIIRVNLGLDKPFYQNITEISDPYQLLVLVNKYNKLPDGFTQYNLVNMNRNYTVNDGKQYLLAGVAYEKYVEMADAARKEGLSMRVISAYRTENYQRNLYNNKLRTTGKTNADNYSARPGHSEHQTGLAVDISSTKTSFEYTAEFKWLQKHAHEYGFILRYPKGKEWITGYSYEPWHYRFVGADAAKIIYEEGITYEEFYIKYVVGNEFK